MALAITVSLNRVRQTWTGHCGRVSAGCTLPAVPVSWSPGHRSLDRPCSPHSTPRCWAFPWHLRGTLATYCATVEMGAFPISRSSAVCRQRWTVRLGEVEPVFGQTTTGQRGTPTRCRRRSITSRKRRTATVEPQVNDRPDQRSVIGPRRFWRAARRFRRWPSQSRSHSTGSGRRGRATAGGSAPAVPFRQSPFPGRLDTGPSTVRVPRIRRRGVGPSRGTSVVRSRRIARRSRSIPCSKRKRP